MSDEWTEQLNLLLKAPGESNNEPNAIITTKEIADLRASSECWVCGADTKRLCGCHTGVPSHLVASCKCLYKTDAE